MFKFILILTSLYSLHVNASPMKIGAGDICEVNKLDRSKGSTACICEVQKKDAYNQNEYPYYKAGCRKWLLTQRCDQRLIVDIEGPVDAFLNKIADLDTIKMGYVGHWANTSETVDYVDSRVVPLAKKYDAHILYDNTGCSGASNPMAIRDFIMNLDSDLSDKVTIKANQNDSVGEWSSILKPILTSNAEITMCSQGMQIPRCRDFDNRNCSVNVNHGDDVGCLDRNTQFHVYKCEDRGERNYRATELGKWTYVDTSSWGTEIIETNISSLDIHHFAALEAEGQETNQNEVVDHYQVRYAKVPLKWFFAKDGREKKEALERLFGPVYSYFSNDEVKLDFVRIRDNKLSSQLDGDQKVYILRHNNPNLRLRMSTSKKKIEFFERSESAIMNYYYMYAEEIEHMFARKIERKLRNGERIIK